VTLCLCSRLVCRLVKGLCHLGGGGRGRSRQRLLREADVYAGVNLALLFWKFFQSRVGDRGGEGNSSCLPDQQQRWCMDGAGSVTITYLSL
jgi:hypothetical protein